MMSTEVDLHFDPFQLSTSGSLKFPSGRLVKLSRRVAMPLRVLAASPGVVVSKAQLLEQCWPESDVGEDSLTRAIADLRNIFRREHYEPIESVYGIGYRLVLPNTGLNAAASQRAASFREEAKLRLHDRRRDTLDAAESLYWRAIGEQASLEDWVGVAELQLHKLQLGYVRGAGAYASFQHAIDGIEEIDPASALPFRALMSCWANFSFDIAANLLNEAGKLEPGAYAVHQCSGIRALSLGNFREAVAHFHRAETARPAALQPYGWKALALAYAGAEQEALATLRVVLEIDDSGPLSQIYSTWIQGLCGLSGPSLDAARRSYDALPDSPNVRALLATALAGCSQEAAACKLLGSRTSDGTLVGECVMAAPAWLALSDSGRALAALQHGLEAKCPWLAIIIEDPRCSTLNSSPEFLSIQQRVQSPALKVP